MVGQLGSLLEARDDRITSRPLLKLAGQKKDGGSEVLTPSKLNTIGRQVRILATIQVDMEGGMSKTDSKQLAEVVGQAIARQRVRCKLSQEQVAERLGLVVRPYHASSVES